MIERDYQILIHVKKHCKDISDFLSKEGSELKDFEENKMLFNAVSMSLMQIGELTKSFNADFIHETEKDVPWFKIKGLRNIVAHGYDGLDKEIIYNLSNKEVKELYDFCSLKIEEYKSKIMNNSKTR